ncbi:MAG TPA: magnesium and cobalt transport protein CorA [Mycobacteriales bacterium]|nr:magnesium and cobalt transport protein CorA [Mycobacteriales bacterium]
MTLSRAPGGSRVMRLPLPSSFGRSALRRVDLSHPRRGEHSGTGLDSAVVDCAVYVDGARVGGLMDLHSAREAALAGGGFIWIGLHEPDAPALQTVADELGLHPLAVEDAVHAHQRPKLETYGDRLLFVVLKTVRYVDHDEVIETGELMVFVGPDYVVSVRHGQGGDLVGVREDLEARPELLAAGPAAVLYAVVDRVVDGYAPAAAAVEEDVDEIEDEVFGMTRTQPTERIYKLKREVMEFRRAVEPLGAATGALAGGQVHCLDPRTAEYFRDVHDHVLRATDVVSGMDELLGNVLSSNLAQVSMRQNEDMRRISAWVAIAAVDTLIAGIYGMNFDHMPELRWALGYPAVLLLMLTFSVSLFLGFKRNDWL